MKELIAYAKKQIAQIIELSKHTDTDEILIIRKTIAPIIEHIPDSQSLFNVELINFGSQAITRHYAKLIIEDAEYFDQLKRDERLLTQIRQLRR